MLVRWNYDESLTFQHTVDETDDPECHLPQPISAAELIVHAANLHLFRTMGHTERELPLWSCTKRPEPVLPLPTPAR